MFNVDHAITLKTEKTCYTIGLFGHIKVVSAFFIQIHSKKLFLGTILMPRVSSRRILESDVRV